MSRILPVIQERRGRRRVRVAVLHLDADECENVAYALGLHDGGAEELLATAAFMRELDAEDDADREPFPTQLAQDPALTRRAGNDEPNPDPQPPHDEPATEET